MPSLAAQYLVQRQLLAGALKKVLVSQVVVVQIGAVQSLITLLKHGQSNPESSYAQQMLEEDLAGNHRVFNVP